MADAKRAEAVLPETPLAKWEVVLSCISLALAFVLAIRAISHSLWRDETATYWVIKDGLGSLFSRCWSWPGASAVYDVTAWAGNLLTPVIGLEPALRVPSVLAAIAAAVLLFRLGDRLLGRRGAIIAVVAFFCIQNVAFAVIDARPYALGLALLLLSMLSMTRYVDTGDRRWALVYVVASALLVYTHYLLALGLAPQLVYAWREKRRMAPWWIGVVALCLPLAGHVLELYRNRNAHLFAGRPDFATLLGALTPAALAAAVFLGSMLGGQFTRAIRPVPRLFLIAWALLPPVLLFLLARVSNTPLFVSRYFLASAPALALLTGWMLSRVASPALANALLLTAFAVLYHRTLLQHGPDDWRAATAVVNAQAAPGDAILVASGFVEATPQAINRDGDVLFSPQFAYPIGKFVRLPNLASQSAVPPDFGAAKHIFLLCEAFQMSYAEWIGQRLPGYRVQKLGPFGTLEVTRFDQ